MHAKQACPSARPQGGELEAQQKAAEEGERTSRQPRTAQPQSLACLSPPGCFRSPCPQAAHGQGGLSWFP